MAKVEKIFMPAESILAERMGWEEYVAFIWREREKGMDAVCAERRKLYNLPIRKKKKLKGPLFERLENISNLDEQRKKRRKK